MKTKTIVAAIALLTSISCFAKTYSAPTAIDFPKPESVNIFCFEGVLYLSNTKGMTVAVDKQGKPLQCK